MLRSVQGILLLSLFCIALPIRQIADAQSQSKEVSVKGRDEFKLKADPRGFKVKDGPLDGAIIEVDKLGIATITKGGETLGTLRPTSTHELETLDKSGNVTFKLLEDEKNFRIMSVSATGQLPAARVKIKDDKFNVYGPDDKRVYHGKQKEDGYKVIDEQDELAWKIKGTESFREASTLSLPLDLATRLLLWGSWYGTRR